MKLLFIGFTKLKYMPYLKTLYDNLDKDSLEIGILYWNRNLKDEEKDYYNESKFFEFSYYQEDDVEKWKKVKSMIHFRHFAKQTIANFQPDRIIVMHSLPAFLIYDLLIIKYNGRFLYDFRDTTFEKISIFAKLEELLIKKSFITFISSDGFRKYFNSNLSDKMITTHNIQNDLPNKISNFSKQDTPIKIGYWGFIRNESLNKEIIDKVAADNRFELHYYGREQQIAINLKHHAKSIGAKNVFFHGEYSPSDRMKFLQTIGITHNIFDDTNMMLAMPNKYYDSLYYGIPQLCMSGSFMGHTATKANVGIELNPANEDFGDVVWEYYNNLNSEDFKADCKKELIRVETQQRKIKGYLQKLCEQSK